MPIIINILISGGVLWALLIVFNESGSFKFVQQEAMLIIGIVAVAGILAALILPEALGLLRIVIQAVVLFFGVEHISQLSKSATIRVTVWYFAIMILISLAFGGLVLVLN